MSDLEMIEKQSYENGMAGFERAKANGKVAASSDYDKVLSMLEDYTDEDYEKFVAYMKEKGKKVGTIDEVKAENRGYARFLREVIPILKACEQEAELEAKKAKETEKEKNREERPIFYIANGGGGDCFDYVGYDTNNHEFKKAFVDWDSGRGNEMLPDWESNDINRLPESCVADFKKAAATWLADKCGAYFFCDYKGNMSVPCKVTTGRKFRGKGTLVRITDKVWVQMYGRKEHNYTAHIIDKDGNKQTAVATRLEFEPGTIEAIVAKAVANMTVAEIQDAFYGMLWHFGRDRDLEYPKILAKAFEDLNKEDIL